VHIPQCKYLRAAGHFDDDGQVLASAAVTDRVRKRAARVCKEMAKVDIGDDLESVPELEGVQGWEWVMVRGFWIKHWTDDLDGVREFLVRHKAFLSQGANAQSAYAKLAVAYDCLRFGPVPVS
jgi:hypothetical protein